MFEKDSFETVLTQFDTAIVSPHFLVLIRIASPRMETSTANLNSCHLLQPAPTAVAVAPMLLMHLDSTYKQKGHKFCLCPLPYLGLYVVEQAHLIQLYRSPMSPSSALLMTFSPFSMASSAFFSSSMRSFE